MPRSDITRSDLAMLMKVQIQIWFTRATTLAGAGRFNLHRQLVGFAVDGRCRRLRWLETGAKMVGSERVAGPAVRLGAKRTTVT